LLIKEDRELNQDSKAYELLTIQSQVELLKEKRVSASTWLNEAENIGLLFESSMYSPDYNSDLTLLKKL
jgi:hypothetical protein